MNNNIEENRSCQVKKHFKENSFSYTLRFGLINECTNYIKSIYELKNNFIKANEKNIKLGNKQEELLIYLYKNYFSKKQPCYTSQSYLAKKLNMHRSHLNRTLKFLEEKKLICAIPFFFKLNKVRTIIIPIIPETEILIEENQDLLEPLIKKQIEILTSYLNKLTVNTTSNMESKLVHVKRVTRVPILDDTCTNQIFKLLNLLDKKMLIYLRYLYILDTTKEINFFSNSFFPKSWKKTKHSFFYNFCFFYLKLKNKYSKTIGSNKSVFDSNYFENEFNKLLDSNSNTTNFDSKLNMFVSKLILQSFGFNSTFIEKEINHFEWNISTLNVSPPGENTERIKKMPKRLILQVKQNNELSTIGIHNYIFNLLKNEYDYEFDKLSYQHQKTFNEYVSCFHGIDIKEHFKISKKTSNKYYNEYAIKIRQMLIALIINNIPIGGNHIEKIINYWNELPMIHEKAIKKISLTNHTKIYLNLSIVISRILNNTFESDLKLVFQAIKRLEKSYELKRPPFNWKTKQITLDQFLIHCSNSLNVYLKSENEFNKFLYEYKVSKRHTQRVEVGYEKFSEFYINNFYAHDVEKGEQKCYDFEHMIKRWMEQRISEIVDPRNHNKERKMYGYSLISTGHDEVEELPPLLDVFFYYIKREYGMVSFKQLFEREMWKEFIDIYMRTEFGLDDFYYLGKKEIINE